MRPEFLQAMQRLCRDNDALFVLDEVQTGVGLTGTPWAYQQLGLEPDVVAFGKKVQLGGIMAGRRVDEVPDNVFTVSSRINSTWGGGLADMVRSRRLLEIIERDGLFDQAAATGAWFLAELQELGGRFAGLVSNVRGRGLMCAFDLPGTAERDSLLSILREEKILLLPCGPRSIRFRPALTITTEELSTGLKGLDRGLARLGTRAPPPPIDHRQADERPRKRVTMASTIVSIINGRPAEGPAAGTVDSPNPSRLTDVVAEVTLADAAHLRRRLRGGEAGAAAVGRHPRPGPRPGDRGDRPASSRPTRRRWPAWSPARSASRTPRRWARSRRSSTPATSSSARAGGCTARRCPARCPTSSCSRSGSRSGPWRWSPRGTSRSPCRPGTSSRRWSPATPSSGSPPSTPPPRRWRCSSCSRPPGLPDGVLNIVFADGPATFAGLEQALQAGTLRQGRLHRLHRRRRAHRRARRAAPADARAWSSAARTRWSSRPTPTSSWPWRGRCSRASAPPGSGAPRWAR